MFKKFLSILLTFILIINIFFSFYKPIEVKASDVIVVGGVTYSALEVSKIILALIGISGGAAFIEHNQEEIKNGAYKVSQATIDSYSQYLQSEKNSTMYTSEMFSEFLDSTSKKLSYGLNKSISISNDLFYSFKNYLNNINNISYSSSITPDTPLIENSTYSYINENIDNIKLYNFTLGQVTSSSGTTHYVDTYVDKSQLFKCPYHENLGYLLPLHSALVIHYPISDFNPNGLYVLYDFITTSCCQSWKISLNSYSLGESISNCTLPIIEASSWSDNFMILAFTSSVSENNDIPSWVKPLENNDIKIKSVGNTYTDNYDVIGLDNSFVDTGSGVIVGDRSITIPDTTTWDSLLDKLNNGEITLQQYLDLVNENTNTIGIDTTKEGVKVGDNNITVPLDTPVTYPVDNIKSEEIEDRNIFEDSVDNSTLNGFPDLTQIFPFCIPFDVLRLLNVLKAEPETPHFEIPIEISCFNISYNMVVDFEQFSTLSTIVRTFLTIIWVVFLILASRKLIRG